MPLPQLPRRLATGSAFLSRAARTISVAGLMVMFALFIFGVGMRYLADRPQSWVDEVVTLLGAWLVFWTAAFVLKWSEFISFDVLFQAFSPAIQRFMALAAALGFVGVMGYSFYGIVDYVMFMKIARTDMLYVRLDLVYSIFVLFMAGICVRLLVLAIRLAFGDWRAALADFAGPPAGTEVTP